MNAFWLTKRRTTSIRRSSSPSSTKVDRFALEGSADNIGRDSGSVNIRTATGDDLLRRDHVLALPSQEELQIARHTRVLLRS